MRWKDLKTISEWADQYIPIGVQILVGFPLFFVILIGYGLARAASMIVLPPNTYHRVWIKERYDDHDRI